MQLIIIFFLLFLCQSAEAATVYVRESGGCPKTSSGAADPGCANICNGTVDVDYSGGVTPNCAYNHPYWPLPANGQDTTYRVSGADKVVISNGTYRMGCLDGATCRDPQYNMTNSGDCDSTYSYDCGRITLPDGTGVGTETEVVGCSTTGCGCSKSGDSITCTSTRPILWSAGRSNAIFLLTGADYVKLKDLEMTDHADGTSNIETVCNTGDHTRLSGLDAIYANSGSNIILEGLYMHGFCLYAMRFGGVDNFTMHENTLTRNGHSGWSMDSCADIAAPGTCGMTGTINITDNVITWNGCTEDYPTIGVKANGCHGQADNVIADGIESADSGGTWTVTGNNISWNTHDGSDLLYVNKGSYSGGSVVYKRNHFEGNGGNGVKGPNTVNLQGNFILGNCGFFSDQSFTSATWNNLSDSCRGSGNGVEIAFRDTTTSPKIIGNHIITNGDVAIDTSGTCTAGTDVIVANNIILGGRQFYDDSHYNGGGGDDSVSIYYDSMGPGTLEDSCDTDFIDTYNICYGMKEGASACDGTGSTDTVAPSFVGGTIQMGPWSGAGYYTGTDLMAQVYLSAANNAADETVSGADSTDYNNYDRGAS